MDTAKEESLSQHSAENTRIENERNPLLEHVKAQVSEQEKARAEKGTEHNTKQPFVCKP